MKFSWPPQTVILIVAAFILIMLGLLQSLTMETIAQAIPTPTNCSGGGFDCTGSSSNDNSDNDDDGDSRPLLAYIELFASSAPAGTWSVVQWQDPQGGWHDVEGWRSVLGSGGYQRWTVEAKDFGTGPFRWQVRQSGPEGTVLGVSAPFTLPAGANQVGQVQISL